MSRADHSACPNCERPVRGSGRFAARFATGVRAVSGRDRRETVTDPCLIDGRDSVGRESDRWPGPGADRAGSRVGRDTTASAALFPHRRRAGRPGSGAGVCGDGCPRRGGEPLCRRQSGRRGHFRQGRSITPLSAGSRPALRYGAVQLPRVRHAGNESSDGGVADALCSPSRRTAAAS